MKFKQKEELKDMKAKPELEGQKNSRVRLGKEITRLGEPVMPFETPKDQLSGSPRGTKPSPQRNIPSPK